MTESTINQRLKFLIDALGLKAGAFARTLGVSETNIRNYTDRTSKPGSEFLEKLGTSFKQVNLTWLITGEGEPLLTPSTENTLPNATARKFSHSQVIGTVSGSATQNMGAQADVVAQLENTKLLLIESKRYSEQLERQLADKERMIQLLLNQQPKP